VKLLALLNIIVFGLIFIGVFDMVFFKKNLDIQIDGTTMTVIFIVFLLPILLGIKSLF
jgi:hypothetical protein